jgi:hypothetical protein
MAKIPDEIVKRVYREAGQKGGRARAAALTAAQRRAIAKQAAKARWARHRKKNST